MEVIQLCLYEYEVVVSRTNQVDGEKIYPSNGDVYIPTAIDRIMVY